MLSLRTTIAAGLTSLLVVSGTVHAISAADYAALQTAHQGAGSIGTLPSIDSASLVTQYTNEHRPYQHAQQQIAAFQAGDYEANDNLYINFDLKFEAQPGVSNSRVLNITPQQVGTISANLNVHKFITLDLDSSGLTLKTRRGDNVVGTRTADNSFFNNFDPTVWHSIVVTNLVDGGLSLLVNDVLVGSVFQSFGWTGASKYWGDDQRVWSSDGHIQGADVAIRNFSVETFSPASSSASVPNVATLPLLLVGLLFVVGRRFTREKGFAAPGRAVRSDLPPHDVCCSPGY